MVTFSRLKLIIHGWMSGFQFTCLMLSILHLLLFGRTSITVSHQHLSQNPNQRKVATVSTYLLSCASWSTDILMHFILKCSADNRNSREGDGHVMKEGEEHKNNHCHSHMGASSRPMFATVTVAVCHCGAGCLLGDIVGEWLVYGIDAKINGHNLWVSFLVGMLVTNWCLLYVFWRFNFYAADYGFALLFGIIFQYFSIAPMSGDYGPVTIWRALKADFLSLTSFQVGLYGWMAIYQVAIWNFNLGMDNVVYWWMMQVECTHLRE